MSKQNKSIKVRPLSVIAYEIIADFKREYDEAILKENKATSNDKLLKNPRRKVKHWRQKYVAALAYVEPMTMLSTMDDDYYMDSARSVVAYGLSNLTTWKGEKARDIKKELNKMLKY